MSEENKEQMEVEFDHINDDDEEVEAGGEESDEEVGIRMNCRIGNNNLIQFIAEQRSVSTWTAFERRRGAGLQRECVCDAAPGAHRSPLSQLRHTPG